MKISRLLATVTIVSAFAFGGAEANAKSKHSKSHHSQKSSTKKKAPQAAMPADDAAAPESESDKAATTAAKSEGPSADETPPSSTTTTTTTDTTVTPPADGTTGTAPPETTTETPPPADAVPPMAQPAPEAVAPSPPPPASSGKTIVFLPMVSASERAEHGYSPVLGIVVSAGGGALDFVGGAIKAATDLGGFWTVRALVGSRSIVGLEAAYVGSAQGIKSLGLANDARLLGNGVEGTLRLNAPLAINKFLLEPFAFAGAGWSHYNIVNSSTGSADIKDSDNVITLPVGGGLSMGYAGFFVDGRFTYRFSYGNDLVRGPNLDNGLDNWTAGGTVGFEF